MRLSIDFFLYLAFFQSFSCVSIPDVGPEIGIRRNYIAFIPAKIIVFPCSGWQTPSPGEADAVCEKFDRFMLESFRNQPHMNGFPPSTIKRIAETENDPKIIDWISKWRQAYLPESDTNRSLTAFYENSLATQNDWIMWLARGSRLTQYTDAVLLPLVENISESRGNERGIKTATRSISITLFLIDSDNSNVIWTGQRHTSITEKSVEQEASFPDWSRLHEQIFIESLWKDYPGRIQNRP